MQYILLIYDNESAMKSRSQAEMGQLLTAYQKFTQDIVNKGNFKAGDPLQPTNTATTVRNREGKTLVTDGPFAETKEQLGGYYLIEAKDLDEAIAIAARVPSAQSGSIEVRPIRKM
ncbi:MAG TPA: YciI family protein [Candidatus Binataceae bacterium]|nr:YciI family protein [Candidatus Binataceae bacterium]